VNADPRGNGRGFLQKEDPRPFCCSSAFIRDQMTRSYDIPGAPKRDGHR
jgi:hypothetical protein